MRHPLPILLLASVAGCTNTIDTVEAPREWSCLITSADPDYVTEIGCDEDFALLASEPLDASIPGAISAKTVLDRFDGSLYFQNSQRYQVHYDFVSTHLSGDGLPIVPALSQFNQTEYYSTNRRFLLGSITFYESAGVWAWELAPYDTAVADLIHEGYQAIVSATYFGDQLKFHPTSEAIATTVAELSGDVSMVTTDELFEGVDYQPLNLGTSYGQLRFFTAAELETEHVTFTDIVVLDSVPNDISVVTGIITAQFQTPLSHINVLSQNRGTPNMALRGAMEDTNLRALEGQWVRFQVGAFDYEVTAATSAEADAWWVENKPEAVGIPALDLTVTELTDMDSLLDTTLNVDEAIDAAIPAFGGKGSHFAAVTGIGDEVPMPKGFGIPIAHYWQFMEENGFLDRLAVLLADEEFINDAEVRDTQLAELRADMLVAPVDETFAATLEEKLLTDFGAIRMRFRSSTNAEDLDGFTGAGLYTSATAAVGDPTRPILDAVRTVWSSVWFFRAFEERSYRSIDHLNVGMALLVHPSFPDEEVNGVALTANPYDTSGNEPGFYINAQRGETSVVKPNSSVTTDQFIYYFDYLGQPSVFIGHSNLVPEGSTVLTRRQTYDLGVALKAIHEYFEPFYGGGDDPNSWYAMDVEFKFEGPPGETPTLTIKQARPHSGWGQ